MHRRTGTQAHGRECACHLGPWTREDLAFASKSEMMSCPSDLVPTLDKPADGGKMPCSASIQDSATQSSLSVAADCEGSGPANCDTSGDGVPTAPSNTWRAARHTRSMNSKAGLTRGRPGRPVSGLPKTCHLCGASEGDEDPVQLPYASVETRMSRQSRFGGTIRV